jgi:putative FmdB family regulatory protein
MPTYEYGCDNCGVRFDRFQSFDSEPLTVCPECGEPALRKLYQPVGIVFKGSGFYATDHRSPSGLNSSRKSEEKPADSGASSSSSTEKKKDSSPASD